MTDNQKLDKQQIIALTLSATILGAALIYWGIQIYVVGTGLYDYHFGAY